MRVRLGREYSEHQEMGRVTPLYFVRRGKNTGGVYFENPFAGSIPSGVRCGARGTRSGQRVGEWQVVETEKWGGWVERFPADLLPSSTKIVCSPLVAVDPTGFWGTVGYV